MGMFYIADPQGSLRAARALAQHMGGGRAWGSQRRVAVGFVERKEFESNWDVFFIFGASVEE